MTTAAELREAIEELSDRPGIGWPEIDPSFAKVLDAARTIALPILEADPELRRRLLNLVINHDALSITEEWAFVDKILATLINTDEESE